MLKNIRLHVNKNENEQSLLESRLSQTMLQNHKESYNAIQRFMPSLLPYVNHQESKNLGVFSNKFGEFNIVDYGTGRTLYGLHVDQEISKQVSSFGESAHYVDLNNSAYSNISESENVSLNIEQLPSMSFKKKLQPASPVLPCLVVLGCGIGLHILKLLKRFEIRHLLIYEPEIQYLQCSFLGISWKEVFELSSKKGTNVYILPGKDGRDLVNNIEELTTIDTISGFYVYKHYHHPVFTSIQNSLTNSTWPQIKESGFSIQLQENYVEYCPQWLPPITPNEYQSVSTSDELFKLNLAALQVYFPSIYEEFKDYKPLTWIPVRMRINGEINLLKKDTLACWYSESPKEDCLLHYQNYSEQPNKDGLILGYNGNKLAHYLHYQYVNNTESLIKELQEESGKLPELLKSLILFGIGTGYQISKIFKHHTVEKIFICEPNRDFFFASLFAINWKDILNSINLTKGRIYLNIGDDGTNLMRDLLNQFYSIGPYILNYTFFYQSYYNSALNLAIAQLREQLQIVISMGEYFDHAYYGISQTQHAIEKRYRHLISNSEKHMNGVDKSVPIFLIGNGPSLDQSIEVIKNSKDKAIIVSCGTCLKVLYKNGITPDFHAEIEQNRTTYEWASMIGDPGYLKSINLISCNGIHPDTCELYKDVFITFKEGESSTVSSLAVLGEDNFQTLNFAFPTVSNFALNLFTSLQFENIYLIGIDLGFFDKNYHHSKDSEYFLENGGNRFDYHKVNVTSLIVEGNFRPIVNTKHEFKVAKQIMEQTIANAQKHCNFYNCSDGARIAGAMPLALDDILITSDKKDKMKVLSLIQRKLFTSIDTNEYKDKFAKRYSHEELCKEMEELENIIYRDVSSYNVAESIIEEQKNYLFDSYRRGKSLLFYFLYGTLNYTNALLAKMLFSSKNKDVSVNRFNLALGMWRSCFDKIKAQTELNTWIYDSSKSFTSRELRFRNIQKYWSEKSIEFFSDSLAFVRSIEYITQDPNDRCWAVANLSFKNHNEFRKISETSCPEIAIFHHAHLLNEPLYEWLDKLVPSLSNIQYTHKPLIVTSAGLEDMHIIMQRALPATLTFTPNSNDGQWISSTFWTASRAMRMLHQSWNYDIIIPRLYVNESDDYSVKKTLTYLNKHFKFSPEHTYHGFDDCIAINLSRINLKRQNFNETAQIFNSKEQCIKHLLRATPSKVFEKLMNIYPFIPSLKGAPSPDKMKFG